MRYAMNTTIRTFAASALLALAASLTVGAAAKRDLASQTAAQEMKAAQSAQEHRDRAEHYQKKAAEYRKEAEAHRRMLADYSKMVAKNPKDTGENAYLKKMRLHCEKYIKAAEALAQEADEMAKFHAMRAKEVEGK
jgi:hypothetical protein